MLIFGHAGITLGAVVFLNATFTKSRSLSTKVNEPGERLSPSPGEPSRQNRSGALSWLNSLGDRIDIRLLLIGSLLPDIIDKPVGLFLFRDIIGSGRIFCHTLFFLILITLGGLYLYWSRKKTWLSVLSFGTFTHLILDAMWLTPGTLFWPLYGLSFKRYDLLTPSCWMQDTLYSILHNPAIWIFELVGVAVVTWFLWQLVRRGKLQAFIRNGQA